MKDEPEPIVEIEVKKEVEKEKSISDEEKQSVKEGPVNNAANLTFENSN